MSIKSHGTLRGALRAEVPWQKLYEHRHQHSAPGAEIKVVIVMPSMPSSSSEAV